jgi:hypothetical protein
MSKGAWGAIIAVVIIVILLVALLLAGVIPGFKSSSSGGGGGPPARSYNVTFSESGLPASTSWSVTLGGSQQSSTTHSIVFSEKNGTYSFTVGLVAGFAASPASGSVKVIGAAVTQTIAFATGYTVTFSESGLTSGKSWSVTLAGTLLSSTTTTIVFSEVNGTYAFTVGSVSGFAASPTSGNVTVSGAAVTQTITFTVVSTTTYSVTFTESGLPSGTNWNVTLAGSTQSSTGSTITFSKLNGTYAYSVGTVSGYTSAPSSGSVTVSGAAVPVTITFTKSTGLGGPAYAITFAQTGLPSTDLWDVGAEVSVGTTPLIFGAANTGPTTEFAIPDGSYLWHVGTNVAGYSAVPAIGNLTVAGAPVTITVVFVLSYPVNFTETGLSSGASWSVTLNGSTTSSVAGSNISFDVPNATYPFTVSALGYTASPASGSVTVSGAPVSKSITFTAVPTYAVTFTESGLSPGTFWSVFLNETLNYSVAPLSIVFHVPNGMYPFAASASGYSASPASGNVTVSGAPVTKAIAFTVITTYNVTFTETGLALGTSWGAVLDGIPGGAVAPASVVIAAPNGVDPFYVYASGYTASPASGNVTVSGAPVTQAITFTAIPPVTLYSVTFNESGLPSFSDWEVSMQSDGGYISPLYSCSNSSIAGTPLNCSLPNGHYSWAAYTFTANYTADPMSGYLTVNGAGASVSVTYVNSSTEYLVSFSEEWFSFSGSGGLPNGSSWSVTLGGVTQSTQGMWLFFLEPNGSTNAYTVTPPAGYVVLPSSGNVTGYSNPYQASEFTFVTPSVYVVFVVAPAEPSGTPVMNSLSITSYGSMVVATRDY